MRKEVKSNSWRIVLDEGVKLYLKELDKRIKNDGDPIELLKEELVNVNNHLTQFQNSNQNFTSIFLSMNERSKRIKNSDLLQLCEQYCRENKIPLKDAQPFFIGLYHSYNIRNWMILKKSDLERNLKNKRKMPSKKMIYGSDPGFKLNEKVISKIDFIRILNALSELRAFINQDGTYTSKKQVMSSFGNLVGVNLTSYHKDLNKALDGSKLERNIEIFKKLEEKTTAVFTTKLDKSK